ncbi:hypothetical protein Y032_0290g1538 [Ancylostoma ceylanicum]|nr:hypothetical protein Y032_0290g1538 [Ancylostoma ceylanicum]
MATFTFLTMFLHLQQMHLSSGCVFRLETVDFTADLMYRLILADTDICIRACYDEDDCILVEHEDKNCSVFKQGITVHKPKGKVYVLRRQESDLSGRALEMAPNLAFQPVPVPTVPTIEECVEYSSERTVVDVHVANNLHFFIPRSLPVAAEFTLTRSFGFRKETQNIGDDAGTLDLRPTSKD